MSIKKNNQSFIVFRKSDKKYNLAINEIQKKINKINSELSKTTLAKPPVGMSFLILGIFNYL